MKLLDTFVQNPIISHTLRSRRLEWRFITTLVLALLLYCPASLVVLPYSLRGVSSDSVNFLDDLADLGSVTFYMTVISVLVTVTLFSPILSVSAIAGEKQRQTLELLLLTLLPARAIVTGKLISAISYSLLFMAIIWPLLLLCLVTGGVALVEFFVASLLLLVTSVAFTAIGLFGSSLSKTITNATMLTYGLFLPGFLIGPFLCMLPMTIAALSSGSGGSEATGAVIFYGWHLAASLNPITAAIYSAILRGDGGGIFLARPTYDSNDFLIFPWVIYVIFYSFITWLLVRLTIRRLDNEVNK